MLEILSQHTKQNAPWAWENDTLDDIYSKLEGEHDIRPDFEDYGNHINYSPQWTKPETAEKYKGCIYIFSSPYVRLITDDKEIIERCETTINGYKLTNEYKTKRSEYVKAEAEKARQYKIYQENLFKKNNRS